MASKSASGNSNTTEAWSSRYMQGVVSSQTRSVVGVGGKASYVNSPSQRGESSLHFRSVVGVGDWVSYCRSEHTCSGWQEELARNSPKSHASGVVVVVVEVVATSGPNVSGSACSKVLLKTKMRLLLVTSVLQNKGDEKQARCAKEKRETVGRRRGGGGVSEAGKAEK